MRKMVGFNNDRQGAETGVVGPLKSLRRERFCREYVASAGNATRAALAAGYSARTARAQGSRLLTFVDITGRINALVQERWDQLGITKAELIARTAAIARFDPRCLFDDEGNLLPPDELDNMTRAALEDIEIKAVVKNGTLGDPRTNAVSRYRAADKVGALRLLLQHMRPIGPLASGDSSASIAERLAAARRRARNKPDGVVASS